MGVCRSWASRRGLHDRDQHCLLVVLARGSLAVAEELQTEAWRRKKEKLMTAGSDFILLRSGVLFHCVTPAHARAG